MGKQQYSSFVFYTVFTIMLNASCIFRSFVDFIRAARYVSLFCVSRNNNSVPGKQGMQVRAGQVASTFYAEYLSWPSVHF